jgi:hypothetical protein
MSIFELNDHMIIPPFDGLANFLEFCEGESNWGDSEISGREKRKRISIPVSVEGIHSHDFPHGLIKLSRSPGPP